MGAKSTISIGKQEAISFVADHLTEVDDATLAELVEVVNDHLRDKNGFHNYGLHNFSIQDMCPLLTQD